MTILEDAFHTCRKPRTCDQCLRLIQIGQRYRKQKYTDGEFVTFRAHEECDEAFSRYCELAGEDPPLLSYLAPEHHGWIIREFPIVADRLGIKS